MKERYCDICLGRITVGEKYIKAFDTAMEGHVQRLKHVGDICYACWGKIKKEDEDGAKRSG